VLEIVEKSRGARGKPRADRRADRGEIAWKPSGGASAPDGNRQYRERRTGRRAPCEREKRWFEDPVRRVGHHVSGEYYACGGSTTLPPRISIREDVCHTFITLYFEWSIKLSRETSKSDFGRSTEIALRGKQTQECSPVSRTRTPAEQSLFVRNVRRGTVVERTTARQPRSPENCVVEDRFVEASFLVFSHDLTASSASRRFLLRPATFSAVRYFFGDLVDGDAAEVLLRWSRCFFPSSPRSRASPTT
jgi:hypothetical protein